MLTETRERTLSLFYGLKDLYEQLEIEGDLTKMLVTNFSAGCQSIRKASSFLSLLVFAVNRPYSIHLSRFFSLIS